MVSIDDEEEPPVRVSEVVPSVEGLQFKLHDKNNAYVVGKSDDRTLIEPEPA